MSRRLASSESSGEPPTRGAAPITWDELARLTAPAADHRLAYANHPLAFGELRLPAGPGPHPLAIVVHGGCWRAAYDLGHARSMAAMLARGGIATWTIEYRRLGDPGGGWTGTFADVARGAAHVGVLSRRFPLDLARVVVIGHSAGGHLALWLAAARRLPASSALRFADPPVLRGVVAVAAISDLRAYAAGAGDCNAAVAELLQGTPEQVSARCAEASPAERLPLGTRLRLVHGRLDAIVPIEQSRRFTAAARAAGDDTALAEVPDAGHFDPVAPGTRACAQVEAAAWELIRG